jgi:hypothetical protein
MRARQVFAAGAVTLVGLCATLACTDTPYLFLVEVGGTGGVLVGAGGLGCSGSCSTGGSGGGVSAPTEGGAPGEAPLDCSSHITSGLRVVQIQTSAGLCVQQGILSPLAGETAFSVVVGPCDWEARTTLWTTRIDQDGVYEIRSESTNFNLDVRYAASSDGTPLVLYSPHQLYNQRYSVVTAPEETVKMVPLHAPLQCVTQVNSGLQIWPCAASTVEQRFRIVSCP